MIAHGGEASSGIGPSKKVAQEFVDATPHKKRKAFAKKKKKEKRSNQ